MKILAIIPHYRHAQTVGFVVQKMRELNLDVLVVDDGSGPLCRAALEELLQKPQVHVLYHVCNAGKGAAVKTGIRYASEQGYTHVLQVDADGQHALNDAVHLLEMARKYPDAVICGWPQYGDDAPKSRLYGRRITNFWNRVHTGGNAIKDAMCGFRIYPTDAVMGVIEQEKTGNRMDFDPEILVRLHWRGLKLHWVKTPVRYDSGGISHFHLWGDNMLITRMHTRLFFGMLRRRFWRN